MAVETELLELAEARFGKTKVDKNLFAATAKGEFADYSSEKDEENDPANADKWGDERVIKAEQIQWLCTDPKAAKLVTHKGIQVIGARIEGELDLQFAKISFPLYFFKCAFKKEINLQDAQIWALYLIGTHTGPIIADSLNVKGSIYLNDGFKAEGEVRLPGATIDGDLGCSKGEFINPGKGKVALSAERSNVKGSVFLREGFKAEGKVLFLNAVIGGDFDCSGDPEKKTKGGEFINPSQRALSADRLNVQGSVFLRDGFKAEGEVRFVGATIVGDLDCGKGEFINPDRHALLADKSNIKGSVIMLNGFKTDGWVSLVDATIDGHFVWTGVESPEKAELDLRSAKIGTLWDDKESWPSKGKLYLHGLVYDNIYDKAPKDAKSRIEWLRLQGGKEFMPQPYEQLAEVLKKSGHEETAKEILIAKNEDRVELGPKLTKPEWWRYKVFGPMIGYGYRPWDVFLKGPFGKRFVGSILFWVVLGWVFFGFGYYGEGNLITPSKTRVYADSAGKTNIHNEYPAFQFITYSIDAFVPVVDLHQTKYWLPNANKGSVLCETRWFTIRWGGILLFYLWVHIAMGWILSTLFIVGFTGLVRK